MREALIRGLSEDRGVQPYGKWRGAFWRLSALVELGGGPDVPGVADADEVLAAAGRA